LLTSAEQVRKIDKQKYVCKRMRFFRKIPAGGVTSAIQLQKIMFPFDTFRKTLLSSKTRDTAL